MEGSSSFGYDDLRYVGGSRFVNISLPFNWWNIKLDLWYTINVNNDEVEDAIKTLAIIWPPKSQQWSTKLNWSNLDVTVAHFGQS